MNIASLTPFWQNWRAGLAAAVAFFLVWCILFFVAFMIAFGNATPVSVTTLAVIGTILELGNPLWGIPAAWILGAYLSR